MTYFSDQDQQDLRVYLRSSNRLGLRVPPTYLRHWLARQWRVTPQEIDDMPAEIIEAEMLMRQIEKEAEDLQRAKVRAEEERYRTVIRGHVG